MDPLKKPVPSGLGRPVKQQGLTHACWLEGARQLDQPRTVWNRVKQKTRACNEPTLRVLSDVLLQQAARPSQTTVEKLSKRWEARDTVSGTQWVGSAKMSFFLLNAAWLNEGRCPGGRPSVSVNKVKSRKFIGNHFPWKQQSHNQKRKKHQPRCSLPESAGGYRCSLFLGQLDQEGTAHNKGTVIERV